MLGLPIEQIPLRLGRSDFPLAAWRLADRLRDMRRLHRCAGGGREASGGGLTLACFRRPPRRRRVERRPPRRRGGERQETHRGACFRAARSPDSAPPLDTRFQRRLRPRSLDPNVGTIKVRRAPVVRSMPTWPTRRRRTSKLGCRDFVGEIVPDSCAGEDHHPDREDLGEGIVALVVAGGHRGHQFDVADAFGQWPWIWLVLEGAERESARGEIARSCFSRRLRLPHRR